MTSLHDEDPLRDEFQRLRSEMERSDRVPDFQMILEKAKEEAMGMPGLTVESGGGAGGHEPSRRRFRWAGWASIAAAAVLAGLLLVDGGKSADERFEALVTAYAADASMGAWRSPTSSLLQVPGMGLTRSVPSVGGAVRGLEPGGPANTPDSEGRDS